jgi:hypothetical protein
MAVTRIINKNMWLYGPGPVLRKPTGLGTRPPLQGLVICASQGLVVSLLAAFAYRIFISNPETKKIENYYKENPPH